MHGLQTVMTTDFMKTCMRGRWLPEMFVTCTWIEAPGFSSFLCQHPAAVAIHALMWVDTVVATVDPVVCVLDAHVYGIFCGKKTYSKNNAWKNFSQDQPLGWLWFCAIAATEWNALGKDHTHCCCGSTSLCQVCQKTASNIPRTDTLPAVSHSSHSPGDPQQECRIHWNSLWLQRSKAWSDTTSVHREAVHVQWCVLPIAQLWWKIHEWRLPKRRCISHKFPQTSASLTKVWKVNPFLASHGSFIWTTECEIPESNPKEWCAMTQLQILKKKKVHTYLASEVCWNQMSKQLAPAKESNCSWERSWCLEYWLPRCRAQNGNGSNGSQLSQDI